ncbi:hypothetical protein K438DRAFT_1931225 [Mycena galopus ATCC 62051]|nr:hypothetical protein K438DRAFT_1931225 [Mycena galopus ATCC 62051]
MSNTSNRGCASSAVNPKCVRRGSNARSDLQSDVEKRCRKVDFGGSFRVRIISKEGREVPMEFLEWPTTQACKQGGGVLCGDQLNVCYLGANGEHEISLLYFTGQVCSAVKANTLMEESRGKSLDHSVQGYWGLAASVADALTFMVTSITQ